MNKWAKLLQNLKKNFPNAIIDIRTRSENIERTDITINQNEETLLEDMAAVVKSYFEREKYELNDLTEGFSLSFGASNMTLKKAFSVTITAKHTPPIITITDISNTVGGIIEHGDAT